jgi:uncharacterized membrane protein YeaQ/YmgE (transglycosylase-associated protein family)
MFHILAWCIYGLIVGSIAKLIHSGKEPQGCLATIAVGVVGSYIGGLLKYALGMGYAPFSPAGILWGVVGGIVFCVLFQQFVLRKNL